MTTADRPPVAPAPGWLRELRCWLTGDDPHAAAETRAAYRALMFTDAAAEKAARYNEHLWEWSQVLGPLE